MNQQGQYKHRYSNYQRLQTNQNKFYKIFCKNCNLVLRPQIRQKKNEEDDIKIMCCIQDAKSIKQLWLIKTVREKKQIVNFYTDLVITSVDGDVLLAKAGTKGSRFDIEILERKGEGNKQIRIKDQNNLYLTLDGTLQVAKLDQADQSQIFYLKEINTALYKEFNQSFIIINPQTKKCLDIQQALKDIGTSVCLFSLSQRLNQRWKFDPPFLQQAPQDTKYSIISMLSGLRLWYGKSNDLIQSDNVEKVWQFKKKHGNSGQLYHFERKKYINRLDQDQLLLKSHSNGTKWQVR